MAAGTLDITIEQGTTFSNELIWKDNQVPPQPIDLTGYTARMQVRSTKSDPTVLAEFTTENGGISIEEEEGKITLFASATTTAGYVWVTGVYDLELVSGAGVVTRLIQGSITIDPEVTR